MIIPVNFRHAESPVAVMCQPGQAESGSRLARAQPDSHADASKSRDLHNGTKIISHNTADQERQIHPCSNARDCYTTNRTELKRH